LIIEQRNPVFLAGLLMYDANGVRALVGPVVRGFERGEDVDLTL
jgi:hypothetical protein